MTDQSANLPDLSGLRILMAEDNITNQIVATEMLEFMGAAFDVAVDGAEALDFLQDNDYDLLLIDIEMPRVSGLDVIRAVRASDRAQATRPIVALTAYAMDDHRRRIMDAGADGLIAKPILSIEEFGAQILSFCGDPADRIAPTQAAPAGGATATDGPLDMDIYNALATSMGADGIVLLRQKALEDISGVRDKIVAATQTGDITAMREASHVLMSVAGIMGATTLQAQSQDINTLANAGDVAGINIQAEGYIGEIDRVLDAIRAL